MRFPTRGLKKAPTPATHSIAVALTTGDTPCLEVRRSDQTIDISISISIRSSSSDWKKRQAKMLSTTLFGAALAVVLTVVSAQLNLPSCISQCIDQSTDDSCKLTDIKCICRQSNGGKCLFLFNFRDNNPTSHFIPLRPDQKLIIP